MWEVRTRKAGPPADNPESFADLDGHFGCIGGWGQAACGALPQSKDADKTKAAPIATDAQENKQQAQPTVTDRIVNGLKTIGDHIFVSGGVGVGVGVSVQADGIKVNAQASLMSQGEVTLTGKLDMGPTKTAGVEAEVPGVGTAGYEKSSQTLTVKDSKAVENPVKKTDNVVGFKSAYAPKAESNGVSLSERKVTLLQVIVCAGICVQLGFGIKDIPR